MINQREYLGTLAKNFTSLHNLEYKVVFNLHENIFFQKLVSKEVLEKVRVKPIEYMKSLLFLDYFSRIMQNNFSVCDNLERLSKAIREKEREEEQKSGIDKGDQGASYFSLETVVLETGLWARESRIKSKSKDLTKTEINQIKARYDKEEKVDLSSPITRKIEPYYEGIGEMILSQISDNMKPYIPGVESRADLGALVFSDYFVKFFDDKKTSSQIYAKLKSKDFLSASIIAYNRLGQEASIDKLKLAL